MSWICQTTHSLTNAKSNLSVKSYHSSVQLNRNGVSTHILGDVVTLRDSFGLAFCHRDHFTNRLCEWHLENQHYRHLNSNRENRKPKHLQGGKKELTNNLPSSYCSSCVSSKHLNVLTEGLGLVLAQFLLDLLLHIFDNPPLGVGALLDKAFEQAHKQTRQSSSHLLVDEGANVLLHLLVLVPHHPPALLHLLWGANLQTRIGERCLIGLLETFVGVILETVLQVVWGTLAHTSSSFHSTTSLGTVRQTLSTFFRAACLHFFINVTTTT